MVPESYGTVTSDLWNPHNARANPQSQPHGPMTRR